MSKQSKFPTALFATAVSFLNATAPSIADSAFINAYKIKGCGAGPGYASSSAEMRLSSITRPLGKDLFRELANPGMLGGPSAESVKAYLLRRFQGRNVTCRLILMPDGTIADLTIEKSSLVNEVDTEALNLVKSGAPFRRSTSGTVQAYSITFPYAEINEIPVAESFIDPDTAKIQSLTKEYDINTNDGFYKAVSALEAESSSTQIETCFKKFYEQPDMYLSMLQEKYRFTPDHAAYWAIQVCNSCEAARIADWQTCSIEATAGLKSEPATPILLFIRALAHKKRDENLPALNDLVSFRRVKENLQDRKTYNQNYPEETRKFFDFLLF